MGLQIYALSDFSDVPEIEEDGKSFTENALEKARFYSKYFGKLTLADDSGLEVDGLKRWPGSIPQGMLEKGHRVKKIIRNSSKRWKKFHFQKEERDLNASWRWYRPMGEKRWLRAPVWEESDSEKRGREGLGMTPSSFFQNMGRRWPNFPSKKKIKSVIEERL